MITIQNIALLALLVVGIVHTNAEPLEKRDTPVPRVTKVCSATALPRPHKYHCNDNLRLKKPVPAYTSVKIAPFANCRNACLVDSMCISFSYDQSYCALYNVSIASQHPVAEPSQPPFWNRNCFRASYTYDPPVLNGDFETGDFTGWTVTLPSSGGGANVVASSANGSNSYSAELSISASMSDGGTVKTVRISQDIPVCGGVEYELNPPYTLAPPTGPTVDSSYPNFEYDITGSVESGSFKDAPYSSAGALRKSAGGLTGRNSEDGNITIGFQVSTLYPDSPLTLSIDSMAVVPI